MSEGRLMRVALGVALVLSMAAAGASPARAAIAFDAVQTFSNSACDPCSWTHTVTATGGNRILVVAANHAPGEGETILGVTYNTIHSSTCAPTPTPTSRRRPSGTSSIRPPAWPTR